MQLQFHSKTTPSLAPLLANTWGATHTIAEPKLETGCVCLSGGSHGTARASCAAAWSDKSAMDYSPATCCECFPCTASVPTHFESATSEKQGEYESRTVLQPCSQPRRPRSARKASAIRRLRDKNRLVLPAARCVAMIAWRSGGVWAKGNKRP